MNNPRLRVLAAAALALALAILACGQGEGQEPDACTDVMTFVADVTVPEGTTFAPGEAFTKTWQIHNDGDCDWSGYQVTFADGEPMGTMSQAVPDTPAGEEAEISIEMTAPDGEGGYIGRWQVESPDGVVLGHLTCSILVVGEGEAADEEEDEPTSESGGGDEGGAATGDLPPLAISNVVPSDATPASGDTVSISFVITNNGSVTAEDFTVVVIPDYSPSGPNNPLEPSPIDQLGPGMSADLTYEMWFGTEGERTVRILASYDWYEDGDAEPGPSEDAFDVTISVGGTSSGGSSGGGSPGGGSGEADLMITEITLSVDEPEPEEAFTAWATVRNRGGTAAEDFDVVFLSTYTPSGPNNPLQLQRIDSLAPGEEETVSALVIYSDAGTYTFRALATYDWYETGDSEPGEGEGAMDLRVTVSE